MKSSLMVLSGVAVALAGPLRHRDIDTVYDVVTKIVTKVVKHTVVAAPTPEAVVATAPDAAIVTVTVHPTTTSSAAAAVIPDVKANVAAVEITSSAAAASTPTDFASTAVWHHNVHRANHSASDVTYSEALAGFAATLSGRCVFEHDVTIGVDSEFSSYGQNIAMYAATDIENLSVNEFLAQSISNYWYDSEIELYPGPYGSEPAMGNFEAWGHYSQIVWSGTKQVGCAIQKCAAGTLASGMAAYMSTCNYYPAGNVDTEYAANVLAPLGRAIVAA